MRSVQLVIPLSGYCQIWRRAYYPSRHLFNCLIDTVGDNDVPVFPPMRLPLLENRLRRIADFPQSLNPIGDAVQHRLHRIDLRHELRKMQRLELDYLAVNLLVTMHFSVRVDDEQLLRVQLGRRAHILQIFSP